MREEARKVKMKDLLHANAEELAFFLETEYDESIHVILGMLRLVGFTEEQWSDLIRATNALAMQVFESPGDNFESMTVEDIQPQQKASDLLALGMLAHELVSRQEQIVALKKEGDKP